MLEWPKLGPDGPGELRLLPGAILRTSRQSKYSVGYSLKDPSYTLTRIRPSTGVMRAASASALRCPACPGICPITCASMRTQSKHPERNGTCVESATTNQEPNC